MDALYVLGGWLAAGTCSIATWACIVAFHWIYERQLESLELYADTIQTLQDQLCEANDSADYWESRCKLLDPYNNYKGG